MIENNSQIIKLMNDEFKNLEQEVLILNTFPSDECIDEIFNLILCMDDEFLECKCKTKIEFEKAYEKIKNKEIKYFTQFISEKHDGFSSFFDKVKEYCPMNYFDYCKELKSLHSSKVNSLKEEKLRRALEELSFMDDIFEETINIKFKKMNVDLILENVRDDNKSKFSTRDYSYKELDVAARKNGFDIRRFNGSHAIYKNINDKVLIIPQSSKIGKGLKISIAKKLSLN